MDEQTTEQAEPAPPSAEIKPPEKDERNMGMLAHLLGIFTGFLGPLIIWLVKKEDSHFIDAAGKEALNFQITLLFVYIGLGVFSCITLGFGALLFFPIWVVAIVFMIIATVKTSKGELYRYPACIRLIK